MITSAAVLVIGTLAAAQQAPTSASRAPFEVILYLHGGPERDAAFWTAVRACGFSAVSVGRGRDAGAPGRHGLGFYADQVAGKGILELREGQFTPVRDRYEAERDPEALVRPACLADPATQAALVERITAELARVAPRSPLAVSLGDEVSATRHANPLDLCGSSAFRSAFRRDLERRFAGDIAALNEVWGTEYAGFEAVVPWTADQIRRRELGRGALPANLAPWSDQLEFTDLLMARMIRAGVQAVERVAPGVPTGLTGLQQPSAYGGHDYARVVPMLTFVEAYDIGGARDLADCLAPTDALRVATLFPPPAGAPPRLLEARLFDLVAHGMGGVIVWSAGEVFDAKAELTDYGRRLAQALRRVRPAAAALGRARIVRSPVWIVESQPSIRAHWMLDSAHDGATWIRRLSSWEATHSTSLAARRSWLALLEDLGLQPRFVPAAALPRLLADAPPRLLILPATLAVSDRTAAAIAGWVRSGGRVVADHGTGLYDEHLRRRESGALDVVFGVRGRRFGWRDRFVREGRGSDRARLASGVGGAERGLSGAIAEDAPFGAVQIENRFGAGRAVYLNLAVCEYAAKRLDPDQLPTARELRARVRRVLDEASVRPPLMVLADGLPTCIEVLELAARDGGRLVAVRVNALADLKLMRALGERGTRPVTLGFPRQVRARDVVLDRDLGVGERFQVELDPFGAVILEVAPHR